MSATTVTPQSTRSRRGVELVLLAFALVTAIAAFANVGLAVQGALPARMGSYAAGFGTLLLVAHLVVRRFAKFADPVLLPAVALLNGLGLVLIHRLDLADAADGEPAAAAVSQITWTALGVLLFVAVLVLVRDHRVLQRFTYIAMAVGLLLLLLPLVPGLGREVFGARIWIRLGPFSFQPGEAAKIVLMVFFAGYLVHKRDVLALARRRVLGVDLPRARDLAPILVVWAVSLVILIAQRDLGTSILFFGAFVLLLYVATERRSWLIIGALLVAAGGYLAYQVFAHVRTRIDVWLDPFDPATGDGYQLVQSLYGLAAGGVLGTGLGQGRPDLIPVAKSDFILSAAGEELGLTGLMAILLLYGVVVERGLRTAIAARDAFGTLLAAGLSFILAIQVFVVVGGVTRLLPSTGLTTPFLSLGGSSLVINWMIVALLLRISDAARRPAPTAAPPSDEQMTQVVRL